MNKHTIQEYLISFFFPIKKKKKKSVKIKKWEGSSLSLITTIYFRRRWELTNTKSGKIKIFPDNTDFTGNEGYGGNRINKTRFVKLNEDNSRMKFSKEKSE